MKFDSLLKSIRAGINCCSISIKAIEEERYSWTRSNRSSSNGFQPVMDATSKSLQLVSLYLLNFKIPPKRLKQIKFISPLKSVRAGFNGMTVHPYRHHRIF